MLQHLDKRQLLASFSKRELPQRTNLGPKDLGELQEQLTKEKGLGYSLEIDEVSMGYASVGIAILDNLKHPLAAIAITMQSNQLEKLQLSSLALLLESAALDLSRKFGHHG
jgi:DNA-binding IclR family transcriptional regulator